MREEYLQTTTGFVTEGRSQFAMFEDPRSRVKAVEAGSPADKAGVKPGDLVVQVGNEPNSILVDLSGPEEKVKAAIAAVKGYKEPVKSPPGGRKRIEFENPPAYFEARAALSGTGVDVSVSDRLEDSIREWPRGKSKLTLTVERHGETQPVTMTFAPATIGLYPTQLYETVSMALLILLLLAYYPYRRHDGQLMVMLMVGYAIHRFINESLRIEPVIGAGLTLSQWGSVVIFVAAVGIEVYLWRTMPSRWAGGASAGARGYTDHHTPAAARRDACFCFLQLRGCVEVLVFGFRPEGACFLSPARRAGLVSSLHCGRKGRAPERGPSGRTLQSSITQAGGLG